jgi:hypothetical protein
VATRPGEGQQNYRDLRERTKRREDRREQNLRQIVELYRARYLHSFPIQILSGGAGDAGIDA